MRTVEILGRKLQVRSSVQDWELYDMPGATAAADDLNTEVDRTIERWVLASNDGQLAPTPKGFDFAYDTWFHPILDKHREFGAWDGEPSANVRWTIRDIMKALGSRS